MDYILTMDWILLPAILFQTYLMEKKIRSAWYVMLLANVIYGYIQIHDQRWGLLALTVIMSGFALKGLKEWK